MRQLFISKQLLVHSLFFLSHLCHANNYTEIIDSLKQVNSRTDIDKNTRGKTLYNLAWYYYSSQLYDNAIHYSRQAFQYSMDNALDTVVHKSAIMLGAVLHMKSEHDSAVYYLLKGAAYFETGKKKQFEKDLAKIYSILAGNFSEQKQYDKAYVYFDKSENIYKEVSDTTGLIFNKIAMGVLFTDILLYDKALLQYNSAIDLAEKSGKTSMLGSAYNDISTVYKKVGDKESAKFYLWKAVDNMTQYQDKDFSGDYYHNLSMLHSDQNNYDSAFYYIDLAIAIFKKQKLQYREQLAFINKCWFYLQTGPLDKAKNYLDSMEASGVLSSINTEYLLLLSELAFKEKKINSAVDYAQKALHLALENNNIQDQKNAYELLYEEYSQNGDFVRAFKAHEKFILLKDSLFNQEKSAAAQKVIVENIIKIKEEEAWLKEIQYEKEKAEKKRLLWIEGSAIAGLLAVLMIIYLMMKNQRQKAKIAESEKAKKELEIELLKKESEEIKKEILDVSLQSLKSKELIQVTRDELKAIKRSSADNASIGKLYSITNQFLIGEEQKTEFQNRVESIQQQFFEKLETQAKLTKTEKKLAALLKLQLTSKEIASILNVSETTVEVYRSKLRKKLNMEADVVLTDYFKNL